MKLKKVLALTMVATMAVGAFVGCGSKGEGKSAKSDAGKVYYLNFKPEADEAWQALAKEYTKETGVNVTVVTAASNKYEETLMTEMSKSEAPTLFHVNGPVGLKNWKDYALDLSDTDVYKKLNGDEYALKEGDEVKGIAMAVETYGIITNTKLLQEAGYTVDDIQSFDDLKKVAEDITARKDQLGFAAFTSAGMDDSSDWRFKTHLSNLPIYFEYEAETRQVQMQSREHILTTTRTSLICTSTTQHVIQRNLQARQVMTQKQSLSMAKQYSSRMVHGNMAT